MQLESQKAPMGTFPADNHFAKENPYHNVLILGCNGASNISPDDQTEKIISFIHD